MDSSSTSGSDDGIWDKSRELLKCYRHNHTKVTNTIYLLQHKPLENLTEGLILGIGNPLLDISAKVDENLLNKYGLKANDAIMADEKHIPLYKELSDKYQVEFIAGGSVQNSLRCTQWILRKPKVCTYFGCVGNDNYAKILKDKARGDGVNAIYQINENEPTGTCAVLITGQDRSLCANLAAAQKFTIEHLSKSETKKWIDKAKFIYSSGFFIAVCPEAMMQLAEHCHNNNLTFSLNISAPFVPQFYKDKLEKLMPYVDILFGNETEADYFAKAFNLKNYTNLEEIAVEIASLPKLNGSKPRVVVITQGSGPVILVENCKINIIPVRPMGDDEIVDTNGAGDAFVGGFLAQLVLGRPLNECVRCGIYTAHHIIRNSGVSFSGESQYDPNYPH